MNKILINQGNCIKKVVEVLENGGLVMHPTETCYGLAVDVFNENSLEKLYKIKEMPLNKPVSILVDSLEMAQKYGNFSGKALKLANKYWPGPLSIIVPRVFSEKNDCLPSYLNENNKFISIRFSSLKFCTEVVSLLGKPITTTSANKFGKPEFYEPIFIKGVDLLVDGGKILNKKPSTIIKVENDEVSVLRQGKIYL